MKNNQGVYKQLLVGYLQHATDGFDNGFDGEVLEAGNSASFYSILDTKKLAIQGRSNNFNVTDQIALGFNSTLTGNFEIHLSDFDGLFENQEIYIEDTFTNSIHNL